MDKYSIAAVGVIISAFVSVPLWLYIQYRILTQLNVDDITWALFWIYFPISVLTSWLAGLAACLHKED